MFYKYSNLIIAFTIGSFEISGIIILGNAENTRNCNLGFTVKVNKADIFFYITAFAEDLLKIFNDIPPGNFNNLPWGIFLVLEPFIDHFEFLKTFTQRIFLRNGKFSYCNISTRRKFRISKNVIL
jgi:hypothetical protein